MHRSRCSVATREKRITIAIKGLDKDTIFALKRSYSPLFYDLMRVLDARRYRKATNRNPALIGDARKDLLNAVNGEEFDVKFDKSDIRYDPWSVKQH